MEDLKMVLFRNLKIREDMFGTGEDLLENLICECKLDMVYHIVKEAGLLSEYESWKRNQ